MPATDLYLIRKNQQWAKYTAVLELSLTGAATSDEKSVWSAEYRDIFSSTLVLHPSLGPGPSSLSAPYALPGGVATSDPSSPSTNALTIAASTPVSSDEVAHEDLRQTYLARTFWKFDRGASATPRYLFAQVQEGDIVADNPPETA